MINYSPIIRYDSLGIREENDPVVREILANLFINDEFYISMMLLPQHFEEWAAGFMFSEGLIKSYSEIKSIEANNRGSIFVKTGEPIKYNQSEKRVLVSGCAHGTVNLSFLNEENLETMPKGELFSYSQIVDMMEQFRKQSTIFNEAGGVHSAALRFKGGEEIFFEDIGRHNAVDKVVGSALMQNLPMHEGLLLTSGRISTEIALKTVKLGIPILVSRSGPTSMSFAIAEKVNMTLIGFARGRRFNVYCGKFRIPKSLNVEGEKND